MWLLRSFEKSFGFVLSEGGNYGISSRIAVFWCGLASDDFTYMLNGYFTAIEAIIGWPPCQWNNMNEKNIWHMMTSSNGTFSALLALCAGNSQVTSEFPPQRPVTRNFDAFFDLRLNKRLSKQSWGWWFETPWRSLWCHRTAAKTITKNCEYFSGCAVHLDRAR